MAEKQMETLLRIHENLEMLKKSKKGAKAKLKEYASQIFGFIKTKYAGKAQDYGIDYQTVGGRETGRLEANIEVRAEPRDDDLGDILHEIRINFAPAQKKGEIVYARHIADDPKYLAPISGILPVVYDCAKNIGLSSKIDTDRNFCCVAPIAITFGGDYTEEKLPEITKLIITIDNLLDFYLEKETACEVPSEQ